jgi:hypothetical protein
MLSLWLHACLLAALPELHAKIHTDAKSSHHQCAVTTVAQGKFISHTPAPVIVAASQTIEVEPSQFVSVLLPAISHRLAPGRAPPTA